MSSAKKTVTTQACRDSYVLAIDLGTSGPKVALVTARGKLVASASRPTSMLLSSDGGAEQRPDDWWDAIVQATADVQARVPGSSAQTIAVCATAQWSGTVPVDRNGQALGNALIWLDSRGAEYVQKLVGGSFGGYRLLSLLKWLRRSGGIPSLAGKEPVAHILYRREHAPQIYRAAYKFLEPKDYLNLRLTGQFAASYDSIALHWVTDNRRVDSVAYDNALLLASTLPREKLPELRPGTAVLGNLTSTAAADLGLATNVKVIMGTPDVHSAAIGSGAVGDYQGHIYVGRPGLRRGVLGRYREHSARDEGLP